MLFFRPHIESAKGGKQIAASLRPQVVSKLQKYSNQLFNLGININEVLNEEQRRHDLQTDSILENLGTDGADSDAPQYETTDLGNAERLALQHGSSLRFCYQMKKWFVWDEKRWSIDDIGEVERRAKHTVSSIYSEAAIASDAGDTEKAKKLAKWALSSQEAKRIRDMINLARSEPGLTVRPNELDTSPWLLNVVNGTIDLKSGQLLPHDRHHMITKLAPVEYHSEATCPTWEEFLYQIMDGNQRLVDFLQRSIGYALTGDVSEQVLFILYGSGSNGKSTFIGTIMAMLGTDYAMKASPELLITKQGQSHPTEKTDLFGRRFVAAIETEVGAKLDEAFVKEATGGDVIRARRMREDFWEFLPTHKIFLATNHKPVIQGTDHAIWRRHKLIPFVVTIPEDEQDKQLPEKLRAELPGILAWAVRGCLNWQDSGLGVPDEVRAATEEYRLEMDELGDFIGDRCVMGPEHQVTSNDLYNHYKTWCGENGYQPLAQRSLGARLAERGLVPVRIGPLQNRGWTGLAIKQTATTASFADLED